MVIQTENMSKPFMQLIKLFKYTAILSSTINKKKIQNVTEERKQFLGKGGIGHGSIWVENRPKT